MEEAAEEQAAEADEKARRVKHVSIAKYINYRLDQALEVIRQRYEAKYKDSDLPETRKLLRLVQAVGVLTPLARLTASKALLIR